MDTEYFKHKCVDTLKRAVKIASSNRDVEALVAISDRWYALMEHAHGDEETKPPVGFTIQEKINDSGKKADKRKG